MIIFLVIYIFGIVASLILFYRDLDEGDEVTLEMLCKAVVFSFLSWVGFVFCILYINSDKVIFIKK